jgi:gliding motility-associated lipoprotein GldD
MFYNVTGNAATNTQFYITDSTKHFMVGSLYFYAKPNYDSIFPAIEFIKKDMVKIMESTQWQ